MATGQELWRQQDRYACLRVTTSGEGTMKSVTAGSCVVFLALIIDASALIAAASCESLSSLTLPNTSITLAEMVPAGGFSLPGVGPVVPQFSQSPAFCRVAATLTPSADS